MSENPSFRLEEESDRTVSPSRVHIEKKSFAGLFSNKSPITHFIHTTAWNELIGINHFIYFSANDNKQCFGLTVSKCNRYLAPYNMPNFV
jgi:hypothetical protein